MIIDGRERSLNYVNNLRTLCCCGLRQFVPTGSVKRGVLDMVGTNVNGPLSDVPTNTLMTLDSRTYMSNTAESFSFGVSLHTNH